MKKLKKILVLGNEFFEQDSLAKKLASELKKEIPNVEFIQIINSFQILNLIENIEDFLILDVVKGLKQPRILKVEELKTLSPLSAHDFDLAVVLKTLGKNPKIIGVPQQGDAQEMKEEVKELINLTLPSNQLPKSESSRKSTGHKFLLASQSH